MTILIMCGFFICGSAFGLLLAIIFAVLSIRDLEHHAENDSSKSNVRSNACGGSRPDFLRDEASE
jgi:hypothetical protein